MFRWERQENLNGIGEVQKSYIGKQFNSIPITRLAHQWLSEILIQSGRTDEGLIESRRALEMDPLSTIMNVSLAGNLYFARKFDESIAQCRKTIELDPGSFMPRERLIQALLEKNQFLMRFQSM